MRFVLNLPRIAGLLRARHAGEIGDVVIEDLVKISWLEWRGGTLQLSLIGIKIANSSVALVFDSLISIQSLIYD